MPNGFFLIQGQMRGGKEGTTWRYLGKAWRYRRNLEDLHAIHKTTLGIAFKVEFTS
jgi:hypothetical protein